MHLAALCVEIFSQCLNVNKKAVPRNIHPGKRPLQRESVSNDREFRAFSLFAVPSETYNFLPFQFIFAIYVDYRLIS